MVCDDSVISCMVAVEVIEGTFVISGGSVTEGVTVNSVDASIVVLLLSTVATVDCTAASAVIVLSAVESVFTSAEAVVVFSAKKSVPGMMDVVAVELREVIGVTGENGNFIHWH